MSHREGGRCDGCPDHSILLIYRTWMGAETQAIKENQPAVACAITNPNDGDAKLMHGNSVSGVSESLLSAEALQGSDPEPA